MARARRLFLVLRPSRCNRRPGESCACSPPCRPWRSVSPRRSARRRPSPPCRSSAGAARCRSVLRPGATAVGRSHCGIVRCAACIARLARCRPRQAPVRAASEKEAYAAHHAPVLYPFAPVHLGPFRWSGWPAAATCPTCSACSRCAHCSFDDPNPESMSHAMARYIGMFDLVRDGPVQAAPAEIPDDLDERARHLKAAATTSTCRKWSACARCRRTALLVHPIRNPMVAALGEELERSQPRSFAAGMDMILPTCWIRRAGSMDRSATTPTRSCCWCSTHATRHPANRAATGSSAPRPSAPRCWRQQTRRWCCHLFAAARPWKAAPDSATCSDVDLNELAVASGLGPARPEQPLPGPALRAGGGEHHAGLRHRARRWPSPRPRSAAFARAGFGGWAAAAREAPSAANPLPDANTGSAPFPSRHCSADSAHHLHLRRARAALPQAGGLLRPRAVRRSGKSVQDSAKNAYYVMKSPIGACARRALGALLLLQFGEARGPALPGTADPHATPTT